MKQGIIMCALFFLFSNVSAEMITDMPTNITSVPVNITAQSVDYEKADGENENINFIVPGDANNPAPSGIVPGPGMEITKLKGVNIIAPKGTRVRKEGSQIIYEDIGEFIGRRLEEIEDKILSLNTQIEEQKAEIQALKESVGQLSRKNLLISQ